MCVKIWSLITGSAHRTSGRHSPHIQSRRDCRIKYQSQYINKRGVKQLEDRQKRAGKARKSGYTSRPQLYTILNPVRGSRGKHQDAGNHTSFRLLVPGRQLRASNRPPPIWPQPTRIGSSPALQRPAATSVQPLSSSPAHASRLRSARQSKALSSVNPPGTSARLRTSGRHQRPAEIPRASKSTRPLRGVNPLPTPAQLHLCSPAPPGRGGAKVTRTTRAVEAARATARSSRRESPQSIHPLPALKNYRERDSVGAPTTGARGRFSSAPRSQASTCERGSLAPVPVTDHCRIQRGGKVLTGPHPGPPPSALPFRGN
ncbi:hypothetical protein NDU88_002922 [Pleurodeles waltl]|uniref:Uncharacterized protein n=1 Tax=Pleurodeles waltl TaxID=8319 RepID=A0AAV7LHB2_PLEWA|nr:hypothetical protein NDU88_002922 [Pleurodeles waltl]